VVVEVVVVGGAGAYPSSDHETVPDPSGTASPACSWYVRNRRT
jgi:hypothetical protein